MKKFILSLAAVTLVTVLNAQVFVGGSVGFNSTQGANKIDQNETKDNTSRSYSFSPMVGYSVNEKVAVGLELSIAGSYDNDNRDQATIEKGFGWGVSPFARYYFLNFNKFSVYGQANFTIAGGTSKETHENTTTNGPTVSLVGLNIAPALQYSFNERIGLFANLNFLSIGYNFSSTKTKSDLIGDVKATASSFNFGANTSNLINTENFQIGFYINL